MTLELFGRIVLLSMLPVTELRLSIPLFATCGNLESINWLPGPLMEFLISMTACSEGIPIWFIFLAAVIGNMLPNFFLLWFLPKITEWLHDHVAPRINRTVFWLHDVIVKGRRIMMIYTLIILTTLGSLYALYHFGVQDQAYYYSAFFGIPLWSYVMFRIANKAYQAAVEEKSIIHWFYNKVHKEHGKKFKRNGAIALVLIVGIPIPGTGSWTGSLLAFLFNIPYWKACALIFLGIIMAASIVTGVSTGLISGLAIF